MEMLLERKQMGRRQSFQQGGCFTNSCIPFDGGYLPNEEDEAVLECYSNQLSPVCLVENGILHLKCLDMVINLRFYKNETACDMNIEEGIVYSFPQNLYACQSNPGGGFARYLLITGILYLHKDLTTLIGCLKRCTQILLVRCKSLSEWCTLSGMRPWPERVEVWVQEGSLWRWQWLSEESYSMWITARLEASMEGCLWCRMKTISRCRVAGLEARLRTARIPWMADRRDSTAMSGVYSSRYGLVAPSRPRV